MLLRRNKRAYLNPVWMTPRPRIRSPPTQPNLPEGSGAFGEVPSKMRLRLSKMRLAHVMLLLFMIMIQIKKNKNNYNNMTARF